MIGDRFWSKVKENKKTGCWEFQSTFTNGYGAYWMDGQNKRAHIIAYEEFFGPIPDGINICHECDNKCCVNPFHLWPGTQADNMEDKKRKGRGLIGRPRPMEVIDKIKATKRERWAIIYEERNRKS